MLYLKFFLASVQKHSNHHEHVNDFEVVCGVRLGTTMLTTEHLEIEKRKENNPSWGCYILQIQYEDL